MPNPTTQHPQRPRWTSIDEAAAYAAVNPRTIRRYIARGFLTGARFGPRLIRVDLNELDAMLRPIAAANEGAA